MSPPAISWYDAYYDYIISVDPSLVYEGLVRAMVYTYVMGHLDWPVIEPLGPASHVIVMAFKTYSDPVSQSYPNSVADLIGYFYSLPRGPLFVAAIGTAPYGLPNAVFPAEMEQVIAVVALDKNGGRNHESNYGPAAELAAFIPGATVDAPSSGGHRGITRIMGASGAAATIGGIAALVWARDTTLTNRQVRERLRTFASHPWNRNWGDGYGWVDAYRASGGFTKLVLTAPACIGQRATFVPVSVQATGDGPFRYQWSNGATTSSTTYPAAPPGGVVQIEVSVTDLIENKRWDAGAYVQTDERGTKYPCT